MDLHQIQVTYQPNEDRLLHRTSFRTDEGALQEIGAWLTRRAFQGLWSGIVDALKAQVRLDKPQAAHASAEIVGMEHHASVTAMKESGGFGSAYETRVRDYPLGETPVLVTATRFSIAANQPLRINFVSESGKGFEIAFTPQVLHGFCKLLMEAEKKAQWDLYPVLPGEAMSLQASTVLN